MGDLLLPVRGHTGVSSWAQHQRRNPRSSEPGTDLFVPHGTPVYAPADGRIWGAGWDINAATGRWVGADFTNGMSFRCMHHADLVRTSGLVERGELIAYSGSSGYGSEFFGQPSRNDAFWRDTGGDHTHITLWPDRNHRFGYKPDGRPYTVDFMDYVGGEQLAATDAKPFTPAPVEPPKRKKRAMIHAAWRDDNGTIAVQARPGGRVTQIPDLDEWEAIAAAQGAEYKQVSVDKLAEIGARFGGFLESPNFDDARTGQGSTILVPMDGKADRYATLGDRAYWIDQATMDDMLAKGAIQVRVPREEIVARTS